MACLFRRSGALIAVNLCGVKAMQTLEPFFHISRRLTLLQFLLARLCNFNDSRVDPVFPVFKVMLDALAVSGEDAVVRYGDKWRRRS